jgi:ribosomal-protein-alanine N-acetyltransferase
MNRIATTDRIHLRRLELSDAASFMDLNADPEVVRYTGDDPFESIAAAETALSDLYRRYERHGFGRWAIIRNSDNSFLGWSGLRPVPREGVDLGFRLGREYWGQGYATEAARACVELAFGEYRLPYLLGRAVALNVASIAVLEKLGFEPWLKTSGHGFDDVRYSILRSPGIPVADPDQDVISACANLRARLLQPADQMDFFMLEGNPNVLRYADGVLVSYEEAGDRIIELARTSSSREADLRVFAASSDRRAFVGTLALVPRGRDVEIGYRLLESRWGQGLGHSLAKLTLQLGRQEYPDRKLVARCDLRNPASLRVLSRLGGSRLNDSDGHASYEWVP